MCSVVRALLLFSVLCVASIAARPQQNQWSPGVNPGNPFFSQPPAPEGATSAAPVVTTATPQFLACLRNCPSTMEYNPICGDDGENYHNNGRLQCAVRCGRVVAAVRQGSCNPL